MKTTTMAMMLRWKITWMRIELILTALAAYVWRSGGLPLFQYVYVRTFLWRCLNHISQPTATVCYTKSLGGNFRSSKEDNILLMFAVNIQAHSTQNAKIKIMWIRLSPHANDAKSIRWIMYTHMHCASWRIWCEWRENCATQIDSAVWWVYCSQTRLILNVRVVFVAAVPMERTCAHCARN